MSDKVQMQCPKCGGAEMWDNRLTKKNPKAPDFKCVDKSCDGVVWPPKNGAAPVRAAAPAAPVKQAYSAGPYIPAIDAEHPELPHEKMDRLFTVYDACLAHAHAKAVERFGKDVTDTAVSSMAATLFIQAVRA